MDRGVRRALVSVFDKDGIVDFAKGLTELGVSILSSGGTARLLREAGIPVQGVSEYTGFPEMLDGRVKTLHPRIHGGILGIRDNADHVAQMQDAGIEPIDLVVVNLYPFEATAADGSRSREDVIEMIDIGGPAMVRAAAKNHADVGVVVSPGDYDMVLDELKGDGALSEDTRRRLAASAFEHTARYDAAVASWMAGADLDGDAGAATHPDSIALHLDKVQDLRYGENPHQTAAFYRESVASAASIARATQLQGKELSFNNILDFDAALNCASSFAGGACAIIKHGNPCGVAAGDSPGSSFRAALECDPLSAFGGVIAFNRPVDEDAAGAIAEAFYEGVVAPGFSNEARARLRKNKNLRLLEIGEVDGLHRPGKDLRRVSGGLLVQDWDDAVDTVRDCKVVTERSPDEDEWRALQFAWVVAMHVKSNAIVYAAADRTLGIGAGQMSRVDSSKLGAMKARSSLEGTAMASDAFFPFRDGIDAAAEVGVRAVVQPGGSIRDEEVVAAANEHGMAMVFTGRRHFRH
jgi:phosphoribosylaminoimidazolecarboxamide formyltransferase/IMP cyclohydrolase